MVFDIKRAIDLSVGCATLWACAPVMSVISLGIVLDSGGPVLFGQWRPGRGGEPFKMYKFCTMRPPHPHEALLGTEQERLTRFGRVLRRTSMDELPNLFNIIKGEMSFVGPRPLLMRYMRRYSPAQARRHEVRPGVLGWAQLRGNARSGWGERLGWDVWYVDHQSLGLDGLIVVESVMRGIRGVWRRSSKGSMSHSGEVVTEFMGSE